MKVTDSPSQRLFQARVLGRAAGVLTMSKLPKAFKDFKRRHLKVVEAYESLGAACSEAGPLDERTRELVKLSLAIGARLEGAVHAHVRRALEAGVSREEVQHVAVLAVTTLGFPTAVAATTWLNDVLKSSR